MEFHHAVACKACNGIGNVGRLHAGHYNSFDCHKVCWKCGSRQGWRDTVVVWVPAWRWLNPFSWGRGEWIE